MKFYESLAVYGNNLACIEQNNTSYTYTELAAACNHFAEHFPAGVKHLVFIQTRNCYESLVGYLGAILSGQAVLLIDDTIDRGLLDNLLNIYQPNYMLRPAEPDARAVYRLGQYELVLLRDDREIEIHPSLSLLLSTSGSTGSPKLVRLTGDNVAENARSIAQYLQIDAAERPITSLPMHYSYGLSVINSHLAVGATILMTADSIVTKTFWEFFKQQKASSFAGVPYHYEILRRLRFAKMDLPTLKTMTQAGGKLAPEYVKEFAEYSREKGFNFYVMYGQTEATARISYLPPESNIEKIASIGRAIPRGRLSVIDQDGLPINKPHSEGELVYEGPNVMMGYAESAADLARGDELGGRLATGDIAYFDEDGYFFITGRKKRFLKIFGNRVNLEEIEQYLKTMNYHCVCGGQDDALQIASTNIGQASQIRDCVTTKFGYHHSAVSVFEVDQIPMNSSGKILYERLFTNLQR